MHEAELPQLFDMLKNYDGSEKYLVLLDQFGVNRANPEFWEKYDEFQKVFNESDPVQAGLFDLNRYYYRARVQQ